MMLCVDKTTFHGSLPDHELGQLQTRAGTAGHRAAKYPRHVDAAPASAHDQDRLEVLLRVVRISDALNQRLAL
jgi:hypothetical protein